MIPEPRIRYVTTEDGVSIAYWTMGEGPWLLYLPPLPQHAQLEWRFDDKVSLYTWLTRNQNVVRLDARNTGLSQRGVADASIEALTQDVEAVLARVGVDRFSVFGHGTGGALAVRLAAAWPERVERLILVEAMLPGAPPTPAREALSATLEHDWETYSEVIAGICWGWGHKDRHAYAGLFRASIDPGDIVRTYDLMRSPLPPLGAIRAPTLIVHHRDSNLTSVEEGRRLAAEIPNAHLVLLEGRYVGESSVDPRMRAAVDEFLGAHPVPARATQPGGPALRTVLFTDLVGHSAMMQRLGDARGRAILREHERITRETLAAHGGEEVKTMGDGFLASFASVTAATECAIALQRACAAWNAASHEQIGIRVGLNAGEPIEEDGDLFGATVILASRIAARASGGEILIPEPVRHLLSGKAFRFADRGEFVPKGFDDAVRVYEIAWRDEPS